MKRLLRASALLALALSFTACPKLKEGHVATRTPLPFAAEVTAPTPTPTPYEDPADCECVRDEAAGRIFCTSACSPRSKP